MYLITMFAKHWLFCSSINVSYFVLNAVYVYGISHRILINSSDAGDGICWLEGINTMAADALAPKVATPSAAVVMAVQNRQHVLLL